MRQTEIEGSDQDTVRAAGICSGDTLWLLSTALKDNSPVAPAQMNRVPAPLTAQLSGLEADASIVDHQIDGQPADMECQALAEQQAHDDLQQLPQVTDFLLSELLVLRNHEVSCRISVKFVLS